MVTQSKAALVSFIARILAFGVAAVTSLPETVPV